MTLFSLMLFYIIIAYVSCSEVNNKKEQTTLNTIVIILDKKKINYDTIFWKNGVQMITQGNPVFSFYPSDYQEKINPIWNITQDTLSFRVSSEWCIVNYRFNPMSYHSFLLFKGDTAFIKHENGIPFLSVSNSITKANDINFDYFKRPRNKFFEGFPIQDIYNQPSYLRYYSIINNLSYETIIKQLKEDLVCELENEKQWLDSLRNNDLVSKQAFDYYVERNHYSLLSIAFENLTKEAMRDILANYNDSLYRKDIFGYYSSYYFRIANSYYVNKIIKYANNTTDYDYKDMYDNLNNDQIISGRLKDIVEWNWTHAIIKQQSVMVGKTYYEKIISSLSDTNLISSLKNEYEAYFNDSVQVSPKMELINQTGDTLSFETVIEQHKGKVIYIDFWASWCEPCLRSMPEAKQLREEYKDKGIVFIYLALNDTKAKWKEAERKHEINYLSESYFIANSKTAQILADLNVSTIPRYLLYNKKGKLVHRNAPDPHGKAIREELNKLLKE